jgi:hypothetical protein
MSRGTRVWREDWHKMSTNGESTGGRVVGGNFADELNFMGGLAENSVPGDFQRHTRLDLPLMKPRFRIASSQVLFGTLLPFFIG